MNLHPKHIEFYHRARRYLREHDDPIGYETMRAAQIEHLADCLRQEAFWEATMPYRLIQQKLLSDFYSLQVKPSIPIPKWLQEQLAELDIMIAAAAREFGFSDSSQQ
jgi:hypothetical protein